MDRRHRAVRAQGQGPDRAAPRQGRLRLPAVQPAADADGAGEHPAAAGHRRPHGRPRLARRGRRAPSASATGWATGRPSCPAASSSGWPAPGRWSAGRRSSSPTSRPATWTPGPAPRCCRCLRRSVRELGQTVVMVTHDPVAASYADRVVFLADGRLVDELRDPTAESVLDRIKDLEVRARRGGLMLRATLRSLLARKLRLLLSATAVVLGVAFVAGALTLTATLGRVFDDLFTSVNANTDVEVRGAAGLRRPGRRPARARPRRRCCPPVRPVDGVAHADRRRPGLRPAARAGRHGLHHRRRPGVRRQLRRRPARPPPSRCRRAPRRAARTEVALDAATAERDRLPPPATGSPSSWSAGRATFTVSGTFGFGDERQRRRREHRRLRHGDRPAPARPAGRVRGRCGSPAEDGVGAAAAARPGRRRRCRRATRRSPASRAREESADASSSALGFFNTVPARLRRGRAVRRRLPHLQHVHDARRAAQRELALLRALGASRRQVTRSRARRVAGRRQRRLRARPRRSASGWRLGLRGAGQQLRRHAAQRAAGPRRRARSSSSLTVGIVVTALAALLPARKASAVPPVAAMRDAATPEALAAPATVAGHRPARARRRRRRRRPRPAGSPCWASARCCRFLGVAALSPLLSRPAARLLGAPLRPRAARPPRAASTRCATPAVRPPPPPRS